MYIAVIIGVILTLVVLIDHARFQGKKRKAQRVYGTPVRHRVMWLLGVFGAMFIAMAALCIASIVDPTIWPKQSEKVGIVLAGLALLVFGCWLLLYYFNTFSVITAGQIQHTTFLKNTKTLLFQDITDYKVGHSRGGEFVTLRGIDRTKNGARIKIVFTPDSVNDQPLMDAIRFFEQTGQWPTPGGWSPNPGGFTAGGPAPHQWPR